MIDAIFNQIKEEVAKGKALPTPVCPEVEEDLKPFILRPMSDDELALMAARDEASIQAEKMVAKILVLGQLGLLDDATPQDIEHDEIARLKGTIPADLFFWTIQANSGWKFAALHQRTHEGRVVLIGLPTKEARAFYRKYREAREMQQLIGDAPKPGLVN
jgi:hypothetical protein